MTDAAVRSLVDQQRLHEYLGEVAGAADQIEVDLLSGGRSNLTFVVRSGADEYVVRRRPLGDIPAGAHDMRREYRVLDALADTSIPVPQVFGFCDDETILGAPFYVMSRVHGDVHHRREDVASLSPSQASQLSGALVDVLAELHAIEPDDVGLSEHGRPAGFVARRISRWLDQWRRGRHREHPLVETLGERLTELVPSDAGSTIVHGDYRLGNTMIEVDTSVRVAAVLDWELSTLGDPLTDLAHLLVYWEPSRGRITHESQLIAEHPGFHSGSDLAHRYADRTGRDLTSLDFYLAFEHWRAAIIKEQIVARHEGGDDPTGQSAGLADSVGAHLEEAADLLGVGRPEDA